MLTLADRARAVRSSWRRVTSVVALAGFAVSCGARNELVVAGGAGGAAATASGATASSQSTSTSSAGGAPAKGCEALAVLDPVTSLTTPVGLAAPDLARLPDGGVLVAGRTVEGGLAAGRAAPFDAWPPATLSDLVTIAPDVSRFVLGPGADGPVGYYSDSAGALTLLMQVHPNTQSVVLGTGGVFPLFVAGAPGRFLTGVSTPTPGYEVLDIGSYEPGSLPQKEEPIVCLNTPERASAVPSGAGFLAAFLAPNPPDTACDAAIPKPGTVIVAGRYDALGGPDLTFQQAHYSVGGDPFFHVLLAPRRTSAGDGAWLLEQQDGSSAFAPGPLVVRRLTAVGVEDPLVGSGLQIPNSQILSEVAIASLRHDGGDELAVAWVDNVDPSAPTVVVQVVRADLSLGPVTSFSTSPAWLFGALHMVASADGTQLFLAWDASGGGAPTVGTARIDCVAPR